MFRSRKLLLALIPCLLTACAGPGYYFQAASGHWKLMKSRQDVNELIGEQSTDPSLAGELKAARSILDFAENTLYLPSRGSYQTYVETGRNAVVWNVVAAGEFSLEAKKWCFPVAGCVPYRGYFEQGNAERFAAKLRDRGLDVAVTPVAAYSTLGWFEDPLLDTMLRGPETQLAATIIHELAHQRLYVKGDTTFNESYASFVETAGVEMWLAANRGPEPATNWLRQRAAVDDFHQLLKQTREALGQLYLATDGGPQSRKAKMRIIDDLRREYLELREHKWAGHDYFAAWFTSGINNARLALFDSYEAGVCAFDGLFMEAGEDMKIFHELARERSELEPVARNKWLRQSCPGIASGDKL
jgi:predicted aminopeptidase